MTARPARRRAGENTRSVHLPGYQNPVRRGLGQPVWRSAGWAYDGSAELGGPAPENPTTAAFAAAVASLEGAAAPEDVAGEAFSSGRAAVNAVFMTFLCAGAHVVAPGRVHDGTRALLADVLSRFGVAADFVDYADLERVRAAVRPATKIIYAETMAPPEMAVADLRGLYRLARAVGAVLIVDSTLATPIVCRPLEHGADLVVHSATSYLGGHGDSTGGVVVGRPDLVGRLREVRVDIGDSLSPDNAFLLRRGLETLPLRVRRACSTAMLFAAALVKHPAVRRVDYPGLPGHPGHPLGMRLFDSGPEGTRYGACLTVVPHGGHEAGIALADGLRLADLGPQVGGTRTTAACVGRPAGADPGAVRFSIGLEDAEDLIADATRALDALRHGDPTRT